MEDKKLSSGLFKIISLPPPHQFFLVTILFIFGVFVSSFLNFREAILIGLVIFLFCLIISLSAILLQKKIAIVLYFFVILAGFFYFQFYNFYQEKHSSYYLNSSEQKEVLAIISDISIEDNGIVSFRAKLLKPWQGKVLIKVRSYDNDFQYGDKILFSGKFDQPPKFEKFDYQAYLAKENIYSVIYYPEIKILARHQAFWLKALLYNLKISFQKQIDKIFPESESSFLDGLLLGEKKTMDKNLQLALQRSGTTHLIALSGYNITIITSAVYFFLISLGIARPKTFWVVIGFLFLFIILTGASSSVVRAGIMGALLVLSNKLGKRYETRNALFFAALIMILFNPKILRFDFGFQLSFAATLGLVYLSPFFNRLLRVDNDFLFNWRGILATTLSAQTMVLPLLILRFGYLPLISPIANICIIMFIPITMLMGFLAILISFLNLWLGYLIGFLGYLLLHFEILMINFFGKLRFAVLDLGVYKEFIFWLVTALIIFFLVQLKRQRKLKENVNQK